MIEITVTFQVEAEHKAGDSLRVEIISRRAGKERRTRRSAIPISDVKDCWNVIFETMDDLNRRTDVKRLTCQVIEGTGSDYAHSILLILVLVAAHENRVVVQWETGGKLHFPLATELPSEKINAGAE